MSQVKKQTSKAAPKVGAAFALSCLLVVGFLPLGSLGYAETPQVGEGTPVVVETSEASPQPETPNPTDDASMPSDTPVETPLEPTVEPQPPAEDAAPVTPTEPVNDRTWFIGADDASAVVAELWNDGTFVIDGAGDTLVFEDAKNVPWLKAGLAADIKRVIFADAIAPKSLAYWFEGCENLTELASVPAALDMTHTFFNCPKLNELPDDFTLAPDAKTKACFGFTELPAEPLTTTYSGTDPEVLAYDWVQDGRALVNPDAPVTPEAPDTGTSQPESPTPNPDGEATTPTDPTDPTDPTNPTEPTNPDDSTTPTEPANPDDPTNPTDPTDPTTPDATTPTDPDTTPSDPTLNPDATDQPTDEVPPVEEEQPVEPTVPQVSITVPSSVSLILGQNGPNSASISVSLANNSEAPAEVVGVRLKKASTDLPGGTWSLVSVQTGAHFVDDARFTPLGLEAVLDTPVMLPSSAESIDLVWEGTFTDLGMKTLLETAAASEGSFAYGTLIWHIEAADSTV